jgi:hypothetical protein
VEKSSPYLWATSNNLKQHLKENNHPRGENSSNPVTLVLALFFFVLLQQIHHQSGANPTTFKLTATTPAL